MSIIVTCGYRPEWCEFVENRLSDIGISLTSNGERHSIHEFTDKMSANYKVSVARSKSFRQINPARAWQFAASDIVIANSEEPNWGWAHTENIFFLEFWKEYDDSSKFILVYCSPGQVYASMLEDGGGINGLSETELHRWQKYHAEMLRFYHNNPEICILINIEAVNGTAHFLSKAIDKKFDVDCKLLNEPKFLRKDNLAEFVAGASDISSAAEECVDLLEELNASADVLMSDILDGNEDSNPANIYFRNRQKLESLESALKKQSQDAEELRELLDREKSAVKGIRTEISQLTGKLNDKNIELKTMKDSIEKWENEQKEQYIAHSEEKSLLEKKIDTLSDEKSSIENRLNQAQTELKQVKQNLKQGNEESASIIASLKKNLTDAQSQTSNSSVEKVSLLELQLEQVQEELEYYFNEHQKLTGSNLSEAIPSTASPKKAQEPSSNDSSDNGLSKYRVDFNSLFSGSGWHPPEEKGRWGGPGLEQKIKLPKLKPSTYSMKLRILDAMGTDITNNLKILIDGVPVKHRIRYMCDVGGRLSPLRRLKAKLTSNPKPFPAEIDVEFNSEILKPSINDHEISIIAPFAKSPISSGETDNRDLTIFAEALVISPR